MKDLPTDLVELTYDYFDGRAMGLIRAAGLDPPVIPDTRCLHPFRPRSRGGAAGEVLLWPEDLTELHQWALSLWMGHLSGWAHYAQSVFGRAMAIRADLDHEIDRIRARHIAATPGKITDRRVLADALPLVLRLREVYVEARMRTRMLEGEVSGLKGRYAALSREVTSREHHARTASGGSGYGN